MTDHEFYALLNIMSMATLVSFLLRPYSRVATFGVIVTTAAATVAALGAAGALQ